MSSEVVFTDIHCHLVPGIDDGSKSWDETFAMARMAVEDGIETIICTPHQLGAFSANDGATIRARVEELQAALDDEQIPLHVLPGGDVRIEDDMMSGLRSGRVLSLADRRRHVLLELPHEMYFPLEPVLEQLHAVGMTGILSHPERNHGLLQSPRLLAPLVEMGCLMQVTAGSLLGTFGDSSQQMSEWMLEEGLVHFLATDAHGPKARRPRMRRAFERAAELTDLETATDLCCRNPAAVARGEEVEILERVPARGGWSRLLRWGRVA